MKHLLRSALAALFALVWSQNAEAQPAPPANLELHFLDVAQGAGTLVICPNGRTMLIDAGSLPLRAAVRDRVRQYVHSRIAPHGGDIDYLILSHPDADHYNLLRPVLANVPVNRAYHVGESRHYPSQVFNWITTVGATNVRLTDDDFDAEPTPNPDIDCGAARVWILAADEQASDDDKNTKSIVVMVRMGDFEAIITGDATFQTENAILGRYTPAFLDIDVLQVGHHGSERTSTSAQWARALSPRIAIMSAGHLNGYGHPRRAVTNRLTPFTQSAAAHPYRDVMIRETSPHYRYVTRQAYREALYSTSTSGTVVVTTTGSGYTIATER